MHFYLQGRSTEAADELKVRKYGEVDAQSFIPGAEVLLKSATKKVRIICLMTHVAFLLLLVVKSAVLPILGLERIRR